MKKLIKTIIRNFKRNPSTNLINLLGLAISMTLVIILSIYCYSELSTDNFHKDGDRVYLYGLSEDRIYTPGILKENIDMKIPEAESTVRITGTWEAPVFQIDDNQPFISDLIFADEDFFKLFSYNFIEGTPEAALREPLTVVITNTLAYKAFGSLDALGKTIKLNNSNNLTVSAVIEEPKANSCLSFSAVTSIATRKIVQNEPGEYTEWGWRDFQTFLLLRKGANPDETSKKILTLFPEDNRDNFKEVSLTPLRKIYFSKFKLYGSNYIISGDKKKVLILVLVAVLVLVVALINFINISSSQWQEKIRQTGIRKIVGARRSGIILDVLAESFIFFLAAFFIAIELVNIVTPYIHTYAGIDYNPKLTYSPGFIFVSLFSIIVLSVLFSIIPALRISSSRAVDNLRKTVKADKTDFSFNSAFVTIQFLIAIVLIAFTLLVEKQVRFGSNNLGFNQKNIIGINMTEQLSQKKEALRNLLLKMPETADVTFTQYYPGRDISQWGTKLETNGETKESNFFTFSADAAALKIMGLKLLSGRFYSENLSSDIGKVVVNETFLREHNMVNPLGSKIIMGKRTFEIIGVVKDFHFQPVNQPIASLAIRNDSYASVCLVSIQPGNYKLLHITINKIKEAVSDLSPSFPVNISFFDKAVQKMYQSELRFRWIFSLLAACAIVICSLGILAMSLFTCQRRIKEIGIRKVNGARTPEILAMLNKDFVKWVIIAFIFSAPLAWYIMYKWLQNFAYKTELSLWIFALAGLLALGIALLTVSWQSWRAASRNPVEALRYE
jgi:putative ABC transport system permease protein